MDGHAASVVADDLPDDGEAKAGAATTTGAGVIESGEAFEDPVAVRWGDAQPIVVDRERDDAAAVAKPDRDGGGGMVLRVLQQVANGPCEVVSVAEHERAGDAGGVDGDVVGTREPGGFVEDDLVEIDRCARSRGRRAVGSGDEEEVGDEAFHVPVLVEQGAGGVAPVGGLRVGEGDLEVGTGGGEGALQLVGGIRHEAVLLVGGGLESIEHRVHRGGQASDLVVVRGNGHPFVQVLARHVGDPGANGFDRPQRPPHGDPGHGRHEGQQERRGDEQAAPHQVECFLCGFEVGGDVDRHRAVARRRTHGEQAVPAAHPGEIVDRANDRLGAFGAEA